MTVIVLGRDNTNRLFIGYERENDARAIAFDFSVWAMQYGPGVLTLLIQRPGDANPYPVVLDVDGNVATWYPSATDTAVSGEGGMIQLIYTVDSIVVKTHIYYLCIGPSLKSGTTPPSGYETWLETLTEIAGQAQEDAASASASAAAAESAQIAIEDMTVSATTLDPDEPATATKTEVGGVVNIEFGIPRGHDGQGSSGAVDSVNGQTGDVVLDAEDVGALPDDTPIPTKTSDLQNDSGFITSAPVTSVNGKTGAVTLNAADVGAGTYSKPIGGIPKTDLASDVQTSLGKADTALQSAPVTSVNGQTGAVTVSVPSASSATPQALGTAAAGTSGDFSRADHVHAKPTYSKSDIGLGNVDNVQQYSASNPPPYPVTSVNGFTGAVSLSIPSTAADVGAVAVAQGVAHAGEFCVVGSDGNITTVTLATWQAGSY